MGPRRLLLAVLVLAGPLGALGRGTIAAAAQAEPEAEVPRSPVGMSVWRRDLVLPGAELAAAPVELDTAVIVRIAAVHAHGTAHRYDLVYYGLEPGDYDLRDYLRRLDGSSAADLPSLPITVLSSLPPGQIRPHDAPPRPLPRLGGYRAFLAGSGVLWRGGLLPPPLRGRRRRRAAAAAAGGPPTLAERLRPLVEAARAGTLSGEERAELELALIALWRRRLGLAETGSAAAVAALRDHAEAGPLLRALEDWLHRPGSRARSSVAELLAPYRDLPAGALDPPGARSDAG
ncbi:MAG: hypothetical protein AB1726_12800 [Planctomycetota bacterium]